MSAAEAPLSPRPQAPSRARLLSPRAWLLSRPLVQAVIYHPKVQWAMTNLGIRRWLAIRRWPPVILAVAGLGMITNDLHTPRWEHDLVGSALYIGLVVTALSADAYLTRRALRLVGLRSRATYLAMGTVLLPLAVGCFAAASRLDAYNNPSLANVIGSSGFLGQLGRTACPRPRPHLGPVAPPLLDLPARWPTARWSIRINAGGAPSRADVWQASPTWLARQHL
jgi:hypothetical protein